LVCKLRSKEQLIGTDNNAATAPRPRCLH
jgi:hypothetical protein